VAVDLDRARDQWGELVATLVAAGAEVELLEPQPGLPDLVFTANAGTVNGGRYVPSRFRHPYRQPEVAHDTAWFTGHGFEVVELPEGVGHEGAGDALPFRGVFLSGYKSRSDAAAHGPLSALLGAPVRPIELVDDRLYHLDLTFCPLDDRRAIVAPYAWDTYGCKVVEALVPEPLVLSDDEMLAFCANSIVVGTTVVMAACPAAVGRRLEAWGYDVEVVDVGEFLKAGGGCRCLTLALDVAVGVPAAGAPPPSTGTEAAR
ncbi:MAG TPA: arginine deiminase-related protein, partial [Acidimicrobiales bacterium]|nr:arginine deiminase-related protein [Acidimicrobiales bacterium]